MMCKLCDKDNIQPLVITETRFSQVICNKFPINRRGHFLIIPKRHVAWLCDLSIFELVSVCVQTLSLYRKVRRLLKPSGINILYNEGVIAGETIPHVHIHIIVRCEGDGIVNMGTDKERPEIREEEIQHFRDLFI